MAKRIGPGAFDRLDVMGAQRLAGEGANAGPGGEGTEGAGEADIEIGDAQDVEPAIGRPIAKEPSCFRPAGQHGRGGQAGDRGDSGQAGDDRHAAQDQHERHDQGGAEEGGGRPGRIGEAVGAGPGGDAALTQVNKQGAPTIVGERPGRIPEEEGDDRDDDANRACDRDRGRSRSRAWLARPYSAETRDSRSAGGLMR